MADLAPNQVCIAINASTATEVLTRLIKNINGQGVLLNSSGRVGQFAITVAYAVRDVVVSFHSPLMVFDSFKIDTTFYVDVKVDFNGLYDTIPVPLPPRCLEACVPFTDWCVTTCLDLGSIEFTIPIPISFNLAATYRPRVEPSDDEFIVYPELVSPPIFLIDPVRIVERVCHALGDQFPWPLSLAADKICDVFGDVFGFFEDALATALNEFVKLFFDATGGWIGVQLKFIKLYHLKRHAFPGSGHGQIPLIPVQLNDLQIAINSADELEARFLVLPAG